jgi:hypothetical protein
MSFTKIFINKTSIPIISIFLFILVIILNSIQYSNNNKKYLQNSVLSYGYGTVNLDNAILFIYNFVGINGFLNNSLLHIIYLIITYSLLSLIEMNIGYLSLIFLLFITMVFSTFWDQFTDAICKNNIVSINGVGHGAYCCGSFLLLMSLGFALVILLKNINNPLHKIIILCLMIVLFFAIMVYEKNITYSHIHNNNSKQCLAYTWHGGMYVFGILCGLQLSF